MISLLGMGNFLFLIPPILCKKVRIKNQLPNVDPSAEKSAAIANHLKYVPSSVKAIVFVQVVFFPSGCFGLTRFQLLEFLL